MKERFLDVIKWGLILVIAGVVFYEIFALTYSNIYSNSLYWHPCPGRVFTLITGACKSCYVG